MLGLYTSRFEISEDICIYRRSVDDLYTNSNCGWADTKCILYCLTWADYVRCFSLKYRKAYLRILFKLFLCHKATR